MFKVHVQIYDLSFKKRESLKLAAIDIGSNGARMLIARILHNNGKTSIKNIEYVRYPLRLGKDVFAHKMIGEKKQGKIHKLMHAFKLLMELHKVDDYLILATSAFREADNGSQIVEDVKQSLGMTINVIDGDEEAQYMHLAIQQYLTPNQNYLHVDVGGGSTELNIYSNMQKIDAFSFPIGSIRNNEPGGSNHRFENMRQWILERKELLNQGNNISGICTGGNINKVQKLLNRRSGDSISISEINNLLQELEVYTLHERINILKLNPDRADTIIPATNIYLSAMNWAGIRELFVPKVGVKDGIIYHLMEKHHDQLYNNVRG